MKYKIKRLPHDIYFDFLAILRLAAYIFTHGMPEDTQILRKQLSDDDLRQVLDEAPAGIYDARSWAYWNLVIGRYDTPTLPVQSFD